MIKLVVLSILVMMVVAAVATALMALMALIMTVLVVAAVTVPCYLLGKHLVGGQHRRPALKPIERLQNLYAEGKIDLFEFESRVAQLVALEQ